MCVCIYVYIYGSVSAKGWERGALSLGKKGIKDGF